MADEKDVIGTQAKDSRKESVKRDLAAAEMRDRAGKRGLIATLIILIIIIVGLIIAAGYFAVRSNAYNRFGIGAPGVTTIDRSIRFGGRGFVGGGQYTTTEVSNGSVTTTVYNYITGVVTAVNSDNIVIAGGGKSTTIQTNGSTTYTDGTKPAVNDTVTVEGTTSGSTITASQITVDN